MGKGIKVSPGEIRAAGSNISGLDTKSYCPSPLVDLPLSEGFSDGLVAVGINEILDELRNIESLMDGILKKFPGKLEKVAALMEDQDNAAAGQFK